MSRTDVPTCATGWRPEHVGCPECGPTGPCIDPEYEALIQATTERQRFRSALTVVAVIVLLIWWAL